MVLCELTLHRYRFMKKINHWIWIGLLLVIVELCKLNPLWVEKYYSSGIYPYIGLSLRWLLGGMQERV